MRRLTRLTTVLILAGCGEARPSLEAETLAVYESLLHDYCCADNVILQAETDTFALTVRDVRATRERQELADAFSPHVGQALRDLYARSEAPRRLPDTFEAMDPPRLSADSVHAMLARIRRDHARRLPDSATVIQLSAVGFSRDRSVAVVRMVETCGSLCGGMKLYAVRKHPAGWVPAEALFRAVF